MTNRFADEEVESSYTYPEGYKLKSIEDQVDRLGELFPSIPLIIDGASREAVVPAIMEGNFVIPRWEVVAKTYNGAVGEVIALIASRRVLRNFREGQLGPKRLRQSARTVDMLRKLSLRQKGHDLLVVPAQFGLLHRGRSIRRAREVFADNEFGLGAFATGVMLLTHPEHLEHYENLWIDCAGDEYLPKGFRAFSSAPIWGIGDDKLKFYSDDIDFARELCGSASACLSE